MADLVRPVRILMVEDSPTDALMARHALEMAKLKVDLTVLEDGVEAMTYLRRQAPYEGATVPDLILLDLNLPRKNGREVLAEVKADPALREIPVVILTTSRSREDVHATYQLHANCYVAKPVTFETFSEVVRSIGEFWFTIVTTPLQDVS
jgi:two-component system, chemotaxis family, response regulator Rcp1